MLMFAYFRASILTGALEPLLEISDAAILSYNHNKILIAMEDGFGNDGLYDAYLRLDLAKSNLRQNYFCNEVGSRKVNLVKFYSFLESKKDVDQEFWAVISKLDINRHRLVFQLGKSCSPLFFDTVEHEHQFGEVDLGYVNRHENYEYKIVVRILDDNFARIIHQVRQSFTMKISEKEVEIEECGIVLREEDNQCKIEGVGANDEPYLFLVEVTETNLGAFLKASTLSNKVSLYIDKPNKVKAMFEFLIPHIGSFVFYYLLPGYSHYDAQTSEIQGSLHRLALRSE